MANESFNTGVPLPVYLPTRYRFNMREGPKVEYSAKVHNDDVTTFIADLQSAGLDFETNPTEGSPITIVSWTTADPLGGVTPDPSIVISDIWERLGNDNDKSIWDLRKVKFEMSRLDSNVDGYVMAAYVRRLVDAKLQGASTVIGPEGNEVNIQTHEAFVGEIEFTAGLNPTVFTGLIKTIAKGVDSFPISTYVLRRTRKLPANTIIQPHDERTNVIYERSVLVSLEAIPVSLLKFSLPEGWYQKKAANIGQQSDGTWILSEEWWWAQEFDTFIYDSFIPL